MDSPPPPFGPFRSSQSTGLSSLGRAAPSQQLSGLHVVVSKCQGYPLNFCHPLLPPACPQVHSLCLRLPSCPANRFIMATLLSSNSVFCQMTSHSKVEQEKAPARLKYWGWGASHLPLRALHSTVPQSISAEICFCKTPLVRG